MCIFVIAFLFLVRVDNLSNLLLLAIFILFNPSLFLGVELLDPTLNAAKMEGLITALTIPESTSLVYGVSTNDTLLRGFR